jgi:hypothetical protein
MSIYVTLGRLVMGITPEGFVSERIFPRLDVPGNPVKVKKFGKKDFKHWHTRRAEHANSNISTIEKPDWDYLQLNPRDSVKTIDKEYTPTVMMPDMINHLPIMAKHTVWTDTEIENRDRLFTAANYPTGSKITLSGTDQFDDYTNSQPIEVIDDAITKISNLTGKKPNRMLLPEDVFKKIKFHPELCIKLLNGQTEAATIEQLKQKFGVEEIIIPGARYYNESTEILEAIWSKSIALFYSNPSPNPNVLEMSFGYRLQMPGYPFVDDEIAGIDKKKQEARRYNDMFEDAVLCAEAGYLIENAIS